MAKKPTYEELEQRVEELEAEARDRKQEEEVLRHFQRAVDAASDAIGMSTPEGVHFYQNKAFDEWFGNIGEDPTASVYVDATVGREVFEIIMKGDQWTGEVGMFSKNRDILDIFLRAYPIKDQNNKVIGLVGVHTDMTELKQAQEALKMSEAKYRTLVEQIPAITYIAALDEASTTLFVSPQIESSLGFSPTEYKEDPDIWKKQLHPDDHDRVMAEVAESHDTSTPLATEYRMLAKDGSVLWFRDEAVIVHDTSGKPLHVQGIMYDITKRRQAEEALQEKRDELKADAHHLEEMNTALKVLMEHREKEKEELEQNILANVKKMVLPYMGKLARGIKIPENKTYLEIARSHLEDLVSPFARKLSQEQFGFSPTELKVADFVRHGKTSKEIASLLNVTQDTVLFHRKRIRRKLGLAKKPVNLRTYLESLPDQ